MPDVRLRVGNDFLGIAMALMVYDDYGIIGGGNAINLLDIENIERLQKPITLLFLVLFVSRGVDNVGAFLALADLCTFLHGLLVCEPFIAGVSTPVCGKP